LLIGNSDDGDVDGDRYICGGDGDLYFLGGKWRMKRDSEGNVIEACKIITNPPIYAKNATLNKERTLHKKLKQKERAFLLLGISQKEKDEE
jgi:hypothetical protein